MGDHFVLLVDRLLTESTLEAAIESRNRAAQSDIPAVEKPIKNDAASNEDGFGDISRKPLVECKICHDDDEDSNMETPCSCSGSLKYAHRKCVQKWCNEKGNTMCEICHQQFKSGYTVSPQLFQFGRIPMHFRGNWEMSRRDTNSPRRIIAMVSTQQNFLNPDFDDENNYNDDYSTSDTRSLACCRSMAVIFMVLLILRHTLPIVINGHNNDYSLSLLVLLFLRTAGIVLPIYVMVRLVTAIHHCRRRNHQVLPVSSLDASTDEEIGHTDTHGS